jgi:hypothetical protein
MNTLRQTSALVVLTLTLAVSAAAGTIHSTGVVSEPPPPPATSQTSSTSTSGLAATVIITILGLIR